MARIDRALVQAEQARRLNPRALLEHGPGAGLRGGLDSLEHTSVAVRSMFRSVLDGVRDHPEDVDGRTPLVRQAFAQLLDELGSAVAAFGALVRSEVVESTAAAEPTAHEALDTLREARARVSDLQLVDANPDQVSWELNEALLEAVQRVLAELDVEARSRRRTAQRSDHSATLESLRSVRDAQLRIRLAAGHRRPGPRGTTPEQFSGHSRGVGRVRGKRCRRPLRGR